jgi:hypothetical protein
MLVSCETSSGRDRLIAGRLTALRTRTLRLANVPTSAGRLFGYERESARLREVIERGRPATVGIRAEGGAGKTEFLARALRPQDCGWPDGNVLVSARHLAAEDIIALVSDAVFAIPDPRARPSAGTCSAALAKRRLLVGLDDVQSAEDLARVREALARSCICFTSEREFQNAADEWIELGPLATKDGVALLQHVGRASSLHEKTAGRIVANLRGNPSRLRCAAALGVPLRTIAAACTSPDAFDDFQLSLVRTRLAPDAIVLLAAVAIFGQAALIDKKAAAVLARGSFIERSSAGWAVPNGLRQRLDRLDDAKATQALLDALRRVNRNIAEPRNLAECAGGLLGTIGRGGASARGAVEIVAREVDRRGLWSLSATLYEALRASATSAGDSAMGTWATHQLGVRRACAGDVDAAHDLFTHALLSQEKSDEVACRALTEVNLATLRTVTPSSSGKSESSLWTNLTVVASGLAIAAGAILVHSVVWSAIVPHARPHLAAQASLPAAVRTLASGDLSGRQFAQRQTRLPGRTTEGTLPAVAGTSLAPLPRAASQYLRAAAPPHGGSRQHLEQAAPPSIVLLSMLPRSVVTGDAATLCISADHAQNLFVTGLGAINPRLTTCRSVRPNKTTTFAASATNALGQQTTRTISVEVR